MGPALEQPLESPRPIVVEGTVRSVVGYDGGIEGWLYRITMDVTDVLEGPPRDTLTFSLGRGACWHLQGDHFKTDDRLIVSATADSGEPSHFLDGPLVWRYEWGDHWTVHGFGDEVTRSLPAEIRDASTRAEILALVAPDRLPYRLVTDDWETVLGRRPRTLHAQDVVTWNGGFVLLDERRVGKGDRAWLRPSIRLSDDGEHWRRVATPFPEATGQGWRVTHLVVFQDSLVALGGHGPSLVAWRSTDGRHWSRSEGQVGPATSPSARVVDKRQLSVSSVAATEDRLVVAAAIWDRGSTQDVVWTTSDGQRWEEARPTGLVGSSLTDIVAGPDGLLARVCMCTRPDEQWSMVGSTDGVTWHTLAPTPSQPVDMASDRGRGRTYAAVLASEPDGHAYAELHAWTAVRTSESDGHAYAELHAPTADGSWERLLQAPADQVSEVALEVLGDTLVLVGNGYGGRADSMWVMTSPDAGETWAFASLPGPTDDWCAARIAIGSRIVVAGMCGGAPVWAGVP